MQEGLGIVHGACVVAFGNQNVAMARSLATAQAREKTWSAASDAAMTAAS